MISRQPDMRRNARNALQESLRHRAMVQTLTPIGKRVLWAPCCLTMLLRGIQLGLSAEQETFTEVLRLWRDSMLKRYRDTIDQLTSDPSRHSVVGTLKRLQAET